MHIVAPWEGEVAHSAPEFSVAMNFRHCSQTAASLEFTIGHVNDEVLHERGHYGSADGRGGAIGHVNDEVLHERQVWTFPHSAINPRSTVTP